MKQVVWTRDVFDFFAPNLNELDRRILETRIAGMTQTAQAFYFNMSVSNINKRIKYIKLVYDEVQKQHPDKLKPRRASAAELYMDTH